MDIIEISKEKMQHSTLKANYLLLYTPFRGNQGSLHLSNLVLHKLETKLNICPKALVHGVMDQMNHII